ELAEKEMRAELQRFPNDPMANCVLGQILLAASKLDDAESYFHVALKYDAGYEDAWLGLGKTEIAMNHPQAAVEPLRKAIQIDPGHAQAHFLLGKALRQSGHAEEGKREEKISIDIQEKQRAAAIEKNRAMKQP
ncbi:MAG: tetratricopeptide repeat protein, partial [Candidatus Sulfotelmatobacter sp.]